MATELQQLWGVDRIAGMVDQFVEDQVAGLQGLNLFRSSARSLDVSEDDEAKWESRRHSRTLPPAGSPDAPSIGRSKSNASRESTPLISIAFHRYIRLRHFLYRERDLGSLRPNAEARLGRLILDGVRELARAANFACMTILTPGGVVVGPTTMPGSEESYTYNYAAIGTNALTVAAGNTVKNPATLFLSGDHVGSIGNIRDEFEGLCGMPPGLFIARGAFYRGVRGNTEFKDWLRGHPTARDFVERARMGDALMDVEGIREWLQWDEFYTTEAGTVSPTVTRAYYLPAEDAIVLPPRENLEDTLGWAEGLIDVPDSAYGFEGSAIQRAGSVREGMTIYAYPAPDPDPPRLKVVFRYQFVPVVLNEDSVLYVNDLAADAAT